MSVLTDCLIIGSLMLIVGLLLFIVGLIIGNYESVVILPSKHMGEVDFDYPAV